MPIHDWTRVTAGTWHSFHLSWIAKIMSALNDGRMPADYYALAEQITGPWEPDVVALEIQDRDEGFVPAEDGFGGGTAIAVATAPPKTKLQSEIEFVNRRQRQITIRHTSGNRIVAVIELVSPGNKSNARSMTAFVDKAVASLQTGYHLLIVDLFPTTSRDPEGIHGAITQALGVDSVSFDGSERLTLAAYSSGASIRAYIEPTAVGKPLMDMPLFLTPETYVNVPLESTYTGAYLDLPRHLKAVLDA